MKFCSNCHNIMEQKTQSGDVIYTCTSCQLTQIGDDYGTLFDEETNMGAENDEKYETFVSNVPYDNAAYLVEKKCPKCSIPYMALIRIGQLEKAKYVCKSCHAIFDYKKV